MQTVADAQHWDFLRRAVLKESSWDLRCPRDVHRIGSPREDDCSGGCLFYAVLQDKSAMAPNQWVTVSSSEATFPRAQMPIPTMASLPLTRVGSTCNSMQPEVKDAEYDASNTASHAGAESQIFAYAALAERLN